MIIKVEKRADPYARIDNRVFNDRRLSFKALGVLAYLLSKPPGWKAQTNELTGRGQEQRDSIRAAFAELRTAGYAELRTIPGGGSEWIIFENPHSREPENPALGAPGFPTVGKSAPINKREGDKQKIPPIKVPHGRDQNLFETAWVNRLGNLYHRRASTPWSDKEKKAFRKILPLDDFDVQMVERYYKVEGKKEKHFLRRDLQTLLNNWQGELDRAREWWRRNPRLRFEKTPPAIKRPARGEPEPTPLTEAEREAAAVARKAEMEKLRARLRGPAVDNGEPPLDKPPGQA